MKNYKDQTPRFRCESCNLCYIWTEHDELPDYFCTDEAPARPIATVGECLEAGLSVSNLDIDDEWTKWANENRVSLMGFCEHYEAT